MRQIHLLHRWDAIATVTWFMYGLDCRPDYNTYKVCRVHSMLIKSETIQ